MKRQTLLMMTVFLGVLLILFTVSAVIRFKGRRAMGSANQQEVVLGELSLKIPRAFGEGKVYGDDGWNTREYRDPGLGTLRIATQPSDGTPWESLCVRWFGLPAYPAPYVRYQAERYDWFFKDIPLFTHGAYALRKYGKQIRFIAFFEQGGTRYWIGLDAREAFEPQKDLFDGMIQSLRTPDGSGPAANLDAALRAVERESNYRFIQPVEIILLIPVMLILLIFIVQFVLRRRAGRLPDPLRRPDGALIFAEENVEIGLVRPFQRKFMDGAVTVKSGKLTIHTFGSPFLTLPSTGWQGRADTGKAWLGLPFVELVMDRPPEVHKWSAFYRGLTGRLRIYTAEAERLRAILTQS